MKNSCRGTTKDGKQCRAAATEGGLCFFHANPKKASELGRMGGRKNRRPASEIEPLPAFDSPSKISAFLDRVISELYTGHLRPAVAATLGPLLNARLRAFELIDMEQRLQELEHQLAESERQDKEPELRAGKEEQSKDTASTVEASRLRTY